jgi:hypothetical protein
MSDRGTQAHAFFNFLLQVAVILAPTADAVFTAFAHAVLSWAKAFQVADGIPFLQRLW